MADKKTDNCRVADKKGDRGMTDKEADDSNNVIQKISAMPLVSRLCGT